MFSRPYQPVFRAIILVFDMPMFTRIQRGDAYAFLYVPLNNHIANRQCSVCRPRQSNSRSRLTESLQR
jgi:hypothetical protein